MRLPVVKQLVKSIHNNNCISSVGAFCKETFCAAW